MDFLWVLICGFLFILAIIILLIIFAIYSAPKISSEPRCDVFKGNKVRSNTSNAVDLSVVVPAFNESLRLPKMIAETVPYLQAFSKKKGITFEIVIVDDGSTDNTFEIAQQLQDLYESVLIIKLSKNSGKGGAVQAGVLNCNGGIILMADADAATDISDLDKLWSAMEKVKSRKSNSDLGLVVGSRAHLENASLASRALHRTILMYGFHVLVYVLCTRTIKDTQCGFKLFTRKCAHVLFKNLHLQRWAFDVELVYVAESLGIPIAEVGVNWHEVEGSKLITTKFDIITTSLSMARDMLIVRVNYSLGIWRLPKI